MMGIAMKRYDQWYLVLFITVFLTGQLPSIASAFAFGHLGKIEIISNEKPALPKWDRVIEKIRLEQEGYQRCQIDFSDCMNPNIRQWLSFLNEISMKPINYQIDKVNSFVNHTPYQDDRITFGISDYWASPNEFFGNSGDCEDYAIAKYVSFRQLGIPVESMKMVVLQDTLRDIAHAILAVQAKGETYVLDNVTNRIAKPSELPHYAPYYAINEQQRWIYYDRPLRLSVTDVVRPTAR